MVEGAGAIDSQRGEITPEMHNQLASSGDGKPGQPVRKSPTAGLQTLNRLGEQPAMIKTTYRFPGFLAYAAAATLFSVHADNIQANRPATQVVQASQTEAATKLSTSNPGWPELVAPELAVGRQFKARDSLACGVESNEDAKSCLMSLEWIPDAFQVQLQQPEPDRGDRLVRFASPRPLGNPVNDLVSMEWYVARDSGGQPKKAAAVVVVHESGRGMTVGRIIAKGLNAQGLHTFMMHLPGYGARRVEGANEAAQMLPALKQGVADVRRARDAVASLPLVDSSVIGVQGTSLGGFVTATVAGVDTGYDRVFILLAGGNLHDVVLNGARDAAKARAKLEAAGVSREDIIELARQVEPLRLAHRIQPATTWLYSGMYDDVVPPACSLALVKAANLPKQNHIEMPADHYSGIIFLPMVIQQMAQNMTSNDKSQDSN